MEGPQIAERGGHPLPHLARHGHEDQAIEEALGVRSHLGRAGFIFSATSDVPALQSSSGSATPDHSVMDSTSPCHALTFSYPSPAPSPTPTPSPTPSELDALELRRIHAIAQ